jgi:ATP-binding protein involved in chromosome partitioning
MKSDRRGATLVTEAQVRQALRGVLDPEIGKPIEDLGMLKDIDISPDGDVRVEILLTIAGCPLRDRINQDVTGAVAPLEGVRSVRVALGEMSGDQRQNLVTSLRGGQAEEHHFFTEGDTEVIAVASGKGGVGKSSVTANLAVAMAAEGHRVGVLDADVWGFSIPRMMGASGQPVGFNNMILPLEANGVRVISMGFFVSDETPVIWRGPMLHKALQQFLGDVYWGELDFLFVDMPPGKLLGVIENMAGFVCPHCGETTDVFGTGGGHTTADALGVPYLGAVPMQVSLREGADTGRPVVLDQPDSPAGQALRGIARDMAKRAKTRVGKSLPLTVAPR